MVWYASSEHGSFSGVSRRVRLIKLWSAFVLGCFTYHTNLFRAKMVWTCMRSALGFIKVLIAFFVLFLAMCLPGVFVCQFPKGFSFSFLLYVTVACLHDAFNTVRYVWVVVLWPHELPCFWNDFLGHMKDHRVGSQSYSCSCFECFSAVVILDKPGCLLGFLFLIQFAELCWKIFVEPSHLH